MCSDDLEDRRHSYCEVELIRCCWKYCLAQVFVCFQSLSFAAYVIVLVIHNFVTWLFACSLVDFPTFSFIAPFNYSYWYWFAIKLIIEIRNQVLPFTMITFSILVYFYWGKVSYELLRMIILVFVHNIKHQDAWLLVLFWGCDVKICPNFLIRWQLCWREYTMWQFFFCF